MLLGVLAVGAEAGVLDADTVLAEALGEFPGGRGGVRARSVVDRLWKGGFR